MSIEANVWNKSNSDWRELISSASVVVDVSTPEKISFNVIGAAASTSIAALAGLTPAADKVPYFNGTTTAALADFPSFGRTLVANANAADARDDLLAEPRETLYARNTQTSSYILALTDAGKVVEMNVGSANDLEIPPSGDVAWSDDTRIDIVQYGAGQTTLVAGSGVTIRSKEGNLKLAARYSGCTLYYRGSDEWVAIGDLDA